MDSDHDSVCPDCRWVLVDQSAVATAVASTGDYLLVSIALPSNHVCICTRYIRVWTMSGLAQKGTAKPNLRGHIIRRKR